MTPSAPNFALIGRSFPSASFESLYQHSLAARRGRQAAAWDAAVRARPVWRGSGEPAEPQPRTR